MAGQSTRSLRRCSSFSRFMSVQYRSPLASCTIVSLSCHFWHEWHEFMGIGGSNRLIHANPFMPFHGWISCHALALSCNSCHSWVLRRPKAPFMPLDSWVLKKSSGNYDVIHEDPYASRKIVRAMKLERELPECTEMKLTRKVWRKTIWIVEGSTHPK